MTAPHTLMIWIALGCIITLGLLCLMWGLILRAAAQSDEDAGEQGADRGSEGSFHIHDEGSSK